MDNKIRLAIVDNHQVVIDGLKSLLEGHPTFVVVHESTKPKEMLDLLVTDNVDILLTDIMMPGMDGFELARKVKKLFPQTNILALSMSHQGALINDKFNEAHVAGYVLKNVGRAEFLEALKEIASGGKYFSPEVQAEIANAADRKKELLDAGITNREMEIIRLIEKEKSNKEIADQLFISERTVETHRKNIFRKTGVSTVLGLVKYAYEHGLIIAGRA
ncbi:response regulator transcription factor [Flavihumibacter rivuli]|uniref:response regulator n=1 Tax=Flavihumibacter rivuli TaxID=2838156 RepID=UPI001BDF1D84|nr:response regulator transcription factor [Flavihumibacter rivuli]ULQ57554.1 response regulator transcription factor [Flavihumibacter rivuli]